jgi:hypothetical protein
MERVLFVIVALTFGTLTLWFRKGYAALIIKDQNRLWGFRFGERTTRLTEIVVVVIAMLALVAGLLAMLGVG